MRLLTKIIIILVIVFLVVNVVATLLAQHPKTQRFVSDYIQQITDKKVAIEGGLNISWGWSIHIYANDIKISNHIPDTYPYLATIEKLELSFSPLKLLSGKLQVDQVELIRPKFWIPAQPSHNKNVFSLETKNKFLSSLLLVRSLKIDDGTLVYQSGENNGQMNIERLAIDTSVHSSVIATEIEMRARINNTPLEINAQIDNLNNLLNDEKVSLSMSGSVLNHDSRFRLYGDVEKLLQWRGVNLWFEGEVARLDDFSTLAGIDLPDYTNVGYRGELLQMERSKPTLIENVKVFSKDNGLIAQASGTVTDFARLQDIDVNFSASGHLLPEQLPAAYAIGTIARGQIAGTIFGSKQALSLDIEQADVFVDDIHLQAQGAINNLIGGDWRSHLQLQIAAIGEHPLTILMGDKYAGFDLNAVSGGAKLTRKNEKYYLSDFTLSENGKTILQGEVNDLDGDVSAEFSFDYTLRSLSNYQGKGKELIGLLDNVSVMGEANYKNGAFLIDSLGLNANGNGLQLIVEKNTRSPMSVDDLRLNLTVRVENLNQLKSLSDLPLPSSLPFEVHAMVQRNGTNLSLVDIKTAIKSSDFLLNVAGEVNDFDSFATDLTFDLKLNNVSPMMALFNASQSSKTVVETTQSAATVFSSDASPIFVTGHIVRIAPFQLDQIDATLNTSDFASLWPMSETALEPNIAANGNVKIKSQDEQYVLNMQGVIGESDFLADFYITESVDQHEGERKKLKIKGRGESKKIDLKNLFSESSEPQSIFSKTPFNLSLMSAVDLDVQFYTKVFHSKELNLDETHGRLTSDSRDIALKISGEAGKGFVNLLFDGHRQDDDLRVKVDIQGENLNVSAWEYLKQRQQDAFGTMMIDTSVQGVGVSGADIMSNADGWIKLSIEQANMKKDDISFLSDNLLVVLVDSLNLSNNKDEHVKVDCGVLNVAIDNGKIDAKEALAIQTEYEAVLGGVKIDFAYESLDAEISVKKRKGLALNTNVISDLVRISGTLSDPEVVPDAKGLLQSGISLGAAIASSGVSLLLEGMLDKNKANSDVCGVVMNKSATEKIIDWSALKVK